MVDAGWREAEAYGENELTFEQQEALSKLGTWEAPHVPSWPRHRLAIALANALLARQRLEGQLEDARKRIDWLENERAECMDVPPIARALHGGEGE